MRLEGGVGLASLPASLHNEAKVPWPDLTVISIQACYLDWPAATSKGLRWSCPAESYAAPDRNTLYIKHDWLAVLNAAYAAFVVCRRTSGG
jgi:hypothetical protein